MKKLLTLIVSIIMLAESLSVPAFAAGNWVNEAGRWVFYHDDGTKVSGTGEVIDGSVYAFDENGYMLTGWVYKRLQLKDSSSNVIVSASQPQWYYFNPNDGKAYIGWKQIDNKWYYFNQNGVMLTNGITPDGKYVDENGIWDPNFDVTNREVIHTTQVVEDVSEEELLNQIVELVNRERRREGKSRVRVDDQLLTAASIRALEIKDNFSHNRPDGDTYVSVFDEVGIEWYAVAENIAYQYDDSAENVMNGWLKSGSHRKNILNSEYTKIGVGTYTDGTKRYWVQLFAK